MDRAERFGYNLHGGERIRNILDRIKRLAWLLLLWPAFSWGYSGTCGIWAQKRGAFVAQNFAGTQTGFDAAKSYVGTNGSIFIYGGCEGLITIGTLSDSVLVYGYDSARWTVYGKSGSFRDRAGQARLNVDSLGVSVTGKAVVADSIRVSSASDGYTVMFPRSGAGGARGALAIDGPSQGGGNINNGVFQLRRGGSPIWEWGFDYRADHYVPIYSYQVPADIMAVAGDSLAEIWIGRPNAALATPWTDGLSDPYTVYIASPTASLAALSLQSGPSSTAPTLQVYATCDPCDTTNAWAANMAGRVHIGNSFNSTPATPLHVFHAITVDQQSAAGFAPYIELKADGTGRRKFRLTSTDENPGQFRIEDVAAAATRFAISSAGVGRIPAGFDSLQALGDIRVNYGNWGLRMSDGMIGPLATNAPLILYSKGTGDLVFKVSDVEKGRWYATDGRFGVQDSLSVTGTTRSNGGLYVGGQLVTKILRATATLNFDLTSVVSQDLTVTVTGAADGDQVSIGVPGGSVTADTAFFGWVSAANTVTIRAFRLAGTPDPASGTFEVTVIQ